VRIRSGQALRLLLLGILPLLLSLHAGQQDVTALNREATELLEAGHHEQALEKYRAAAALDPADRAIRFNIGLTLYRLGRYEEALPHLEESLGYEPSAAQAHYLRGVIYFELRRYTECAGELEHVRANSRYGEQALYMLEESYRESGKAEAAEKAFVEIEGRYPDSAFLHKLMGMAYEARDHNEEAIREFEAALRVRPGMPDIAFGIGFIHFKQSKYDEAVSWFEKELSVQPCYAQALHYLGEIHRLREEWAGAEVRYRSALECDPSLVDARIGLGSVLDHYGYLDQAIAEYQFAVRLAPERSQAYFKLAATLRKAGRKQEALKATLRAQKLYKKDQQKQATEREARRSR